MHRRIPGRFRFPTSKAQWQSFVGTLIGDSGSGGTAGIVPAPASGDATKFLRGDATWATPSSSSGGSPGVCDFRLTLESGVAASVSDQTAKTTVYCTPFEGNRIGLYSGSAWNIRTSAEFSASLSGLTANTNYDVFCYDNSGTPTLELTAWTNATTRATALTTQDGVLVKSGSTTRRYLGTIRTTGSTGQCEDSLTKRFVWNYYNRRPRTVYRTDTTNSWNYSTQTWRQQNNSTSNQVAFVRGIDQDAVSLTYAIAASSSTTTGRTVRTAIGLDSTTAPASTCRIGFSQVSSAIISSPAAQYDGYPGLGYHYLTALEWGEGTDTQTWYGQSGISPEVRRNSLAGIITC